jgi:hypothetical protein
MANTIFPETIVEPTKRREQGPPNEIRAVLTAEDIRDLRGY